MRKLTLIAILVLLTLPTAQSAHANDIDVYNVTEQNYQVNGGTPNSNTTLDIKFDLTWKNPLPSNSTDGNGQAYWDRAWVFVKYINVANMRTTNQSQQQWNHATLSTAGTTGTTLGAYLATTGIGVATNGVSTVGKGVFCKTGLNQVIRWNIGVDESSLASTSTYKVRVFAIEMVLVPTGPFWVGTGGTESGSFTQGPWTSGATIPLKIISEALINIDNSSGNLWGTSSSGNNSIGTAVGVHTDTLPAAFPKGYAAFYIMKYDVSQQGYCDFLNVLSRPQQVSRVAVNVSNDAPASNNIYVMASQPAGATTALYRNNIVCPASGNGSGSSALPITFSTSTPHRACNFLCWADLCAYADWAALRPMTELEFEKACRGGSSSSTFNGVANEYPWGTAYATLAATLVTGSDGITTEAVSDTVPTNYGLCCYSPGTYTNAANGQTQGPLRCGFAATANTNRVSSGASYYGALDLGGNV